MAEPTNTTPPIRFHGLSGSLNLCPGPVRDVAPVLQDCIGGEVGGTLRFGNLLTTTSLGAERRTTQTTPETKAWDYRLKFHLTDIRTLYEKGDRLAVLLVQRAGMSLITSRGGDDGNLGGGFYPDNSDELAVGFRNGLLIGIRLAHTSRLLSSDETAADWNLTHSLVLTWGNNFRGPRDDLPRLEAERHRLEGLDGKGGEVEAREMRERELDRLQLALNELTSGTELDLLLWRYGDVPDLNKLAKNIASKAILKRRRGAEHDEEEKAAFEALGEEIKETPLSQILDRQDRRARTLQWVLSEVDRDEFRKELEAAIITERQKFARRFGDLDTRLEVVKHRQAEAEGGLRGSLVPYHAANIFARAWHSVQMNELAQSVYNVPGTRDQGRLFILALNPVYDIPLILSTEGIAQDADRGLAIGATIVLAGAGAFQIVQGTRDDNLGQQGNGIVLVTAVSQTLPTLFGGRNALTKAARFGMAGFTALALSVGGAYLISKGDDEALGYRLLSIAGNQAIAGGVIFFWGP